MILLWYAGEVRDCLHFRPMGAVDSGRFETQSMALHTPPEDPLSLPVDLGVVYLEPE